LAKNESQKGTIAKTQPTVTRRGKKLRQTLQPGACSKINTVNKKNFDFSTLNKFKITETKRIKK